MDCMENSVRPTTILAGYEIGSVIGVGTYGEVRVGKHVSTGKRVAVKIVDLSRFEQDTASVMLKEIEILRSMDHPHIVRILDVKERVPYPGKWCSACACSEYRPMLGTGECANCAPHDGHDHSLEEVRQVMMLIQDLAVGGELFGLLMHTGPFPEEIARYYFHQLISGLDFLHNHGVVHRDLKPENLVLDGHFQLKIVDFGLAARVSDVVHGVLHTGVGSAPYSAPEVFYAKELYQSRGYSGQAADIWSCAVILFVMLCGRPPFVRPLARTYAPHLKRCKHFVNLLRGQGYGNMSTSAKSFLMKLFQLDARERLTIDQIKQEEWFCGPIPSFDTLCRTMEEKSQAVWMAVQKPQMLELLAKQRADMQHTPVFAAIPLPVSPPFERSPRRNPSDPFAHANVDISLLNLEEESSNPVFRSLHGDVRSASSQHCTAASSTHNQPPKNNSLALSSSSSECDFDFLNCGSGDNQRCCGELPLAQNALMQWVECCEEDDEGDNDDEEEEEEEDSGEGYDDSHNRTILEGKTSLQRSASPLTPSDVTSFHIDSDCGLALMDPGDIPLPSSAWSARYSRVLFPSSKESVVAQLTHRLTVLGMDFAPLTTTNQSFSVRGSFNGESVQCLVRSVPVHTNDNMSFVLLEFHRIRADVVAFSQFVRFCCRS